MCRTSTVRTQFAWVFNLSRDHIDNIIHIYPINETSLHALISIVFLRYNCSENSFTFYTTLYLIKSFSTLVFHSIMLVVLLLSIGSTVIFYQFDLVSDMPLTIIATGLFFPISFGYVVLLICNRYSNNFKCKIGSANGTCSSATFERFICQSKLILVLFSINWTFTRREAFINNIADLKSCILGMYMCVKEWKRRDSDIVRKTRCDRQARVLIACYHIGHSNEGRVCCDITIDSVVFDAQRFERGWDLRSFSESFRSKLIGTTIVSMSSIDKYSQILEELRTHDDWIKSVISRAYQYHRFIVMDFEKLRVVHDYR